MNLNRIYMRIVLSISLVGSLVILGACSEDKTVLIPSSKDSTSYYHSIGNESGQALKNALHDLIDGHQVHSYKKVWDILKESDQDAKNPDNVILIYSGRSQHKDKNSGRDNRNPDYWNREHVWSKSHGFKQQSFPAYSDAHHIRPADASINRSRGNLDFDDGGKPNQEAPQIRDTNSGWSINGCLLFCHL